MNIIFKKTIRNLLQYAYDLGDNEGYKRGLRDGLKLKTASDNGQCIITGRPLPDDAWNPKLKSDMGQILKGTGY